VRDLRAYDGELVKTFKKLNPSQTRGFFVEGHRRRPWGRRAHPPRPVALIKGDSCCRKNPRATIGSPARMRVAEKYPLIDPSRDALLLHPFLPRLTHSSFVRPRSLSTRARTRARKIPDDTAWTTLRRRCCRRPSSTPPRPPLPRQRRPLYRSVARSIPVFNS